LEVVMSWVWSDEVVGVLMDDQTETVLSYLVPLVGYRVEDGIDTSRSGLGWS
jgi:hypothetical protein